MITTTTIFKEEIGDLYKYIKYLTQVFKDHGVDSSITEFLQVKISKDYYEFIFWKKPDFIPTRIIHWSTLRSVTESFFNDISDFDIQRNHDHSWSIKFTWEDRYN